MATVDKVVRPRIRPRKIIERPRLIRLLEDSKARLRLLVGAAGYGKTTLAEQWAARPGRRAVWVRCRRSASDIAVISRLVAQAGATVLPGCDRRFEQRLSVTPDPAREADVLAEILAEDLAGWPADAWIVIDDYHFVMEAAAAERFVEVLASQSPVQFLIASRQRPTWVSSRDLVYQHAAEVNQALLAMTRDEAEEVLEGTTRAERREVVGVAAGWPAVIGLVGFSESASATNLAIPQALYSFFEEEVLSSVGPRLRELLVLIALLPYADRALLASLLGQDHVGVLRAGLATGLLGERNERLELHPLAASYFSTHASELCASSLGVQIRRALEWYTQQGEWDAAFEVVNRHGTATDLSVLLATSLDALVTSARLATLERWTSSMSESTRDSTYALVTRSELAFRHGQHRAAQTLAERAIGRTQENDNVLKLRSLLIAGRAAHAGSREADALGHFQKALEVAATGKDQIVALHGMVMSAAALEIPDAHEYLRQLDNQTNRRDPNQVVRLMDRHLSLGLRFGTLADLGEARSVSELIPEVVDPLTRCSFRSMFSCSLALAACYDESLTQAVALCQDASEYRLRLAFPYGFATAAVASAGMRRFDSAHAFLDAAEMAARECHDQYGLQNVFAIRTRVFLQEGRAVEACALEPPDVETAIPSMRGEVLASRGLALACIGRLEVARGLAEGALSSTQAIEARVLARAVHAVVGLLARESSHLSSLGDLVSVSFDSGAVDPLITAYRGCPDLLSSMLSYEPTRESAIFVLARSGDDHLASRDGSRPSERLRPLESLTRREREVCDLACHGLSNQDIARVLFIAESTVKVHLHKIYDKVGVRSRTALMSLVTQDQTERHKDDQN